MVPIPLNDDIRRHTFWTSTLLLIAANFAAFLFELSLGRSLNRFVFVFGVVPARYINPHGVAAITVENPFVPILVSMFLHGGWLHLLGNMLFLFVFGRSVEDRFGHLKFLG